MDLVITVVVSSIITTVLLIFLLAVGESNLVKCQEENKKDFLEKG